MNEPCRFRQYINEDGSVGKVYNLSNGATVKVNDADFVPIFEAHQAQWNKQHREFHKKMMSMGVKAYRYNDGWVDRKKCIVTFFSDEQDEGAYWGNMSLELGDKIFIGDLFDGGRFAIITAVFKQYPGQRSRYYGYKPLDEVLDGEGLFGKPSKFLTALTYHPSIWQRWFGKQPYLKSDICQSLESEYKEE